MQVKLAHVKQDVKIILNP